MMYMFIGYTRIPAKRDIRLVYPAGKFGAGVKPRAKPKARPRVNGSTNLSQGMCTRSYILLGRDLLLCLGYSVLKQDKATMRRSHGKHEQAGSTAV